MATSLEGSVLPAELLADGQVVGSTVRVQTRAGESFQGVVFTLDPVANFLILGTGAPSIYACGVERCADN